MKSNTSFIKPLVYVLAILVVGISVYYSVSNIAYYNKTGQLAAVGFYGGYSNIPAEESERLIEKIQAELILTFRDKVTFRSKNPKDVNPAFTAFSSVVPRNTLRDIEQEDVVTEYRKIGDSRIIKDSNRETTYEGDFSALHCQKVFDYSASKTTEIKNGNISLQIRPWVSSWTKRVNQKLKELGISLNNVGNNGRLNGLYAIVPHENDNEGEAYYYLSPMQGCNIQRLLGNYYDQDVVEYTDARVKQYLLKNPGFMGTAKDIMSSVVQQELVKPYYIADYYINTRNPNNDALIDKKINKFIGILDEAIGKNPNGSWLKKNNFETTFGSPLVINIYINNVLRHRYVYKVLPTNMKEGLVKEIDGIIK